MFEKETNKKVTFYDYLFEAQGFMFNQNLYELLDDNFKEKILYPEIFISVVIKNEELYFESSFIFKEIPTEEDKEKAKNFFINYLNKTDFTNETLFLASDEYYLKPN